MFTYPNAVYSLKGVNGYLEVWENKIVITRKGFRAFLTHGCAGVKTIPMSAIQSVQFKPGGWLLNGFIQFGILGGRERQGGVFSATRDENSVMLKRGTGESIYNYIAEIITKRDMSYKANASLTTEEKCTAEERRIAEEKRIAEESEFIRLDYERRTAGVCRYCGDEFKGVFTKKCKSCGKKKDYHMY